MDAKKSEIDTETSRRITSLRFLLAVLVVFIHNNFTPENIAKSAAEGGAPVVFNENFLGIWIQRIISGGISSCAVPLFFMFAAFLCARKNDSYKTMIKKKSWSLALPYALWLFIYFLYFCVGKFFAAKFFLQFCKILKKMFFRWV